MELALYMVVALCTGAAVAGALARTWTLHSRLYSLEDRCAVLEGTVNREVKIRAAAERWKAPAKDEANILEKLQTAVAEKPNGPWWKRPGLKRGAYTPGKAHG